MDELTQQIARQIIDRVGGSGQPPEYGFQYFTAGLDPYLAVIEEEYFSTFLSQGGSTFKMVVGVYGGGKTHFLLNIRDLAWKFGFVTANVGLSPHETPFSKLEKVYNAIAKNLVPPLKPDEITSGYERGIEAFIKRWVAQKYQAYEQRGPDEEGWKEVLSNELKTLQIESTSFLNAFREAVRALIDSREDDFSLIGQWLKGEGFIAAHKRFGILQRIDKTTAFEMIRSLSQLIRQLGYSGLIISFDEAEQQTAMGTGEREALMSNLRQVIDECPKPTFQGVMIFYAVPDENFLQGRTQDYEALRQRVQPVFEKFNPTGVKIELDKVILNPEPFLIEVGEKLAQVYQVAYNYKFESLQDLKAIIQLVAEIAITQIFADIGYKRVFVQKLIRGLGYYRNNGSLPRETDLE